MGVSEVAASSQLFELVEKTITEIKGVASEFSRVYVMFSGGRDSLVALHLTVTALGSNTVEALFIDTGIATPGLREYVVEASKEMGVKLNVVEPKYDYFELVLKKGFPTITRRWCKEYLKMRPLRDWVSAVKERVGEPLLVTGVRADESWMKSRAKKVYKHPFLKATTYAPILNWKGEQVKEYIRLMKLRENPLYKKYGKAYDCWCSVYKSPADFAVLALNNPEFFKKLADLEARLEKGGSALYYSGERIFLRDIAANPQKYLEKYPRKYTCPLCKALA